MSACGPDYRRWLERIADAPTNWSRKYAGPWSGMFGGAPWSFATNGHVAVGVRCESDFRQAPLEFEKIVIRQWLSAATDHSVLVGSYRHDVLLARLLMADEVRPINFAGEDYSSHQLRTVLVEVARPEPRRAWFNRHLVAFALGAGTRVPPRKERIRIWLFDTEKAGIHRLPWRGLFLAGSGWVTLVLGLEGEHQADAKILQE